MKEGAEKKNKMLNERARRNASLGYIHTRCLRSRGSGMYTGVRYIYIYVYICATRQLCLQLPVLDLGLRGEVAQGLTLDATIEDRRSRKEAQT